MCNNLRAVFKIWFRAYGKINSWHLIIFRICLFKNQESTWSYIICLVFKFLPSPLEKLPSVANPTNELQRCVVKTYNTINSQEIFLVKIFSSALNTLNYNICIVVIYREYF
jgi:hypothetical protein